MARSYYRDDPKWIVARYPGTCRHCGEPFKRGADVFYYPKGKATYVNACAARESASFEAAAADEYFATMGGRF